MTYLDLREWRNGHAAANRASEALRTALAALGIPERHYRHIRPAMASTGRPYVYLGLLSAGAAGTIAEALRHHLTHPCPCIERPPRGSTHCDSAPEDRKPPQDNGGG